MMKAFLLSLAATALLPVAAHAAPAGTPAGAERIPVQLDDAQREAYRAVFAAIHAGRWTDAQIDLDAMKPGPLHAIARAELYTAKGSPKVEADALVALLTEAPELPEAFLPWNILVYLGLWHFRKSLVRNRYRLFFSVWLLAQFTLLTLASRKRVVYLMALTPAAAVLVYNNW